MVTIVRQSNRNVEAGDRGSGGGGGGELESEQEEVWGYSLSISAKDFDRGGSEATGQKGRKQAYMYVIERVGGEKSGSCGHEFLQHSG